LGTTSRAPVELRRYPWTWRTRLRIKRAEVWVRDKGSTSAWASSWRRKRWFASRLDQPNYPPGHTLVRNGMKLGWECTALAVECQQVIVLRLLKLSRGGTAASTQVGKIATASAWVEVSAGNPRFASASSRAI